MGEWKNKKGTSIRSCKCKTWKQHWINNSSKPWPKKCSVKGCDNVAKDGAHIIHDLIHGERIVPMCKPCNQRTDDFNLVGGTTLVSANKSQTCEK